MHIDNAVRRDIDHGLRDDLAVADHRHGIGCECGQILDRFGAPDALGLVHGHAEPQCRFFHGRGGELMAAPAGAVGLLSLIHI